MFASVNSNANEAISETQKAVASKSEDSNNYLKALELGRQGKWEDARQALEQVLEKNPGSPSVLYNLGVSEYHLKRLGAAIGYWRKAVYRGRGYSPAEKALAEIEGKFPGVRQDSAVSEVFSWLFRNVPFHIVLAVCLFTFVFAILKHGKWMGQKCMAERMEEDPPPRPVSAYLGAALGFALLSLLVCVELWSLIPRATVIKSGVELRVGPSEKEASLLLVPEGSQVRVLRSVEHWVQVEVAAGAAGWVPEGALMVESDERT